MVISNLGHVAGQRQHDDRAIELSQEALDIERKLGRRPNAAISTMNIGTLASLLAGRADALERLKEAIALAYELGYKEVMAYAVAAVVRIRVSDGELPGAALLAGSPTGSCRRRAHRSRGRSRRCSIRRRKPGRSSSERRLMEPLTPTEKATDWGEALVRSDLLEEAALRERPASAGRSNQMP